MSHLFFILFHFYLIIWYLEIFFFFHWNYNSRGYLYLLPLLPHLIHVTKALICSLPCSLWDSWLAAAYSFWQIFLLLQRQWVLCYLPPKLLELYKWQECAEWVSSINSISLRSQDFIGSYWQCTALHHKQKKYHSSVFPTGKKNSFKCNQWWYINHLKIR